MPTLRDAGSPSKLSECIESLLKFRLGNASARHALRRHGLFDYGIVARMADQSEEPAASPLT